MMNFAKCRRCGHEYDYDAPEAAVSGVDELCPSCLQDADKWLQARYRARDAAEAAFNETKRGSEK